MEIRDLRVFQCVALHGSISKAAAELNYVQSNVTARIKKLEKLLQTTLFYRHSRGMILNAEGKKLLQYTQSILASVDEIKKSFQDHEAPSGLLEIGIVETVIDLPIILSAYHRKYPKVDLSLKAGVTEQLLQDVLDFKLDGAFITGPVKHPSIEYMDVFEEELVLVSRSNKPITPEELVHTPLLVFNKGCGYRWRLESWLKEIGILPRQVMEFGTFETIIGSVAAGLGITIVPRSTVEHLIASSTVFCHDIPIEYRMIQTVFIYRKDTFMPHAVRTFIEEIEHTRG